MACQLSFVCVQQAGHSLSIAPPDVPPCSLDSMEHICRMHAGTVDKDKYNYIDCNKYMTPCGTSDKTSWNTNDLRLYLLLFAEW